MYGPDLDAAGPDPESPIPSVIRTPPPSYHEALHRWRRLHHWINRQLQHPDCPIEAVSLDEARILANASYPDASTNVDTGPNP